MRDWGPESDSQHVYEGKWPSRKDFNWAFVFAALFSLFLWGVGVVFVIEMHAHADQIYRWCQTLMGMVAS